jgi:hypothetical protein
VSNAVVTGILSGVVTGVILGVLAWAWQWWVRRTNTEKFNVTLPVMSKMEGPEFKFGVIYACNNDGTIINRIHWFRKGRGGKFHAEIRTATSVSGPYSSQSLS